MIPGLDQLTFGELRTSNRMVDLVSAKLQTLDTSKFTDDLLARRVNTLIEIIRETLLNRYQDLSVLAFGHFIVALDYFLNPSEPGGVKDTLPQGYSDDLQVVDRVCRQFDHEIKTFQSWLVRQPKDDL